MAARVAALVSQRPSAAEGGRSSPVMKLDVCGLAGKT
jgi:hypothetical protein